MNKYEKLTPEIDPNYIVFLIIIIIFALCSVFFAVLAYASANQSDTPSLSRIYYYRDGQVIGDFMTGQGPETWELGFFDPTTNRIEPIDENALIIEVQRAGSK